MAVRVQTVRDLGAMVRAARRARGLTQADVAAQLRVSRDWVVRLEQGSPRLEAQKVLDALSALGLLVDVVTPTAPATTTAGRKPATKTRERSAVSGRFVTKGSPARKAPTAKPAKTPAAVSKHGKDPFAFLQDRTS